MGITLTAEQRAKLEREDSLILDLPGANGVDSAVFHNPETGQEYPRLPIDAYHLTRYLRRGLRMGPATAELKAAWLAGGESRKEADDASVSKYKDSDQYRLDQEGQAGRFNEAVAAAVTQVLEKLGMDLPTGVEKVVPAPTPEEPEKEAQLDFFQTIDASAESETKQQVSQASRPDLRLVG